MKKKIAMQWADALESGEYKQTKGCLRQAGRFCCLGVLCNLHAQAHPEIAKQQKLAKEYMGEYGLPPSAVWEEWAGMASDSGYIETLNDELAHLNDSGKSFADIAKLIRKHYKEL